MVTVGWEGCWDGSTRHLWHLKTTSTWVFPSQPIRAGAEKHLTVMRRGSKREQHTTGGGGEDTPGDRWSRSVTQLAAATVCDVPCRRHRTSRCRRAGSAGSRPAGQQLIFPAAQTEASRTAPDKQTLTDFVNTSGTWLLLRARRMRTAPHTDWLVRRGCLQGQWEKWEFINLLTIYMKLTVENIRVTSYSDDQFEACLYTDGLRYRLEIKSTNPSGFNKHLLLCDL